MYKKNSKGITWPILIGIILAIIVFIIIVFFTNASAKESEYQTSILTCQKFIKSIEGKPAYFTDKYNEFTKTLIDSIAKICPYKNTQISSKNIDPALTLIKDCYAKTAKGYDFLPNSATNMSLCIYCGRIQIKDDIDNLKEQFDHKLQEDKYKDLLNSDSQAINLNPVLFDSIPQNIDSSEDITLFYYITNPPLRDENTDTTTWLANNIGRPLSNIIGSTSNIGSKINYYYLNNKFVGKIVETYSGIIITTQIKYDDTNEKEFENIQNQISKKDCFVIIPDNYFE